jgi:hypothetical protein
MTTTLVGSARSGGRAVPQSGGRTGARSGGQAGTRSPVDTRATGARATGGRATGGRATGPSPKGTDQRYAVAGTSALAPAPAEGLVGPSRGSGLRVAPPAPVRAPRAPFVSLVLVLVIGGVLGILVLNTKINENAFRLHDLQKQQVALDERKQQLADELAQRESPNSLAAQARRLGLVRADTPAYLHVPDGRVAGSPAPALGTPSVTGGQNAASDVPAQPAD